MIELQCNGAARTVTGSKHLLRTSRASVLLDCGLFQGHRAEARERNHAFPIDVGAIDAVVLSHAHIDHSGALPLLWKKGYRGAVYTTPATRDLCAPMLLDSALIQKSDAEHSAKLIAAGRDIEPVVPLYDADDVAGLLGLLVGVPYGQAQAIAPGVTIRFLDAGHVLGSAIVVIDVEDEGARKRIVYTGDLGRRHLPLLRDPEVPDGAHCLVMESTYGDRLHDPIESMGDALADVVKRTFERHGKIVMPSFALERAQEVTYELKILQKQGRLPRIPVYVDSPLAVKITDIFKLHPECLDAEARALLEGNDSPFELDGLRYISDASDSKAIDIESAPSIIISASGMCEAGRVLHHLRSTISDARNTVVLVGFQAEHTLGRRLAEHREEVRIFGMMVRRAAEVVQLHGFSAHADQKDLVDFAEAVRARGSLEKVVLVHGEPRPQAALTKLLEARGFPPVLAPSQGERVEI